MEKVENVVKAPKNPTNKKARSSGPKLRRSSSSMVKKPIAKEPKKLTAKVP